MGISTARCKITFLASASVAIWALPSAVLAQVAADGSANASVTPAAPLASPPDAATPSQQPPASAEAKSNAEIVVTGSRIKAPPVGSQVVQLGRQDLVSAGVVSTNQLVQNLPQVTNQGVSQSSRGSSAGSANITYASGFNIHGVGPYATLTMLNGRRIVQSGAAGGLPDPDDTPTIAIDRVDVVADGASAIYGSDAVAGVVNLVTRRKFSGLETSSHFGLADSYHEYNFGVIAGHNWSTGNITLAYEHSGHTSLNGQDRGFYRADLTARGGRNYSSTFCNNVIMNGTSYALPGLAANTQNTCDTLKSQDLLPSQTHDNAMLSLTQEVGERVTLTFDGFWSKRKFRMQFGTSTAELSVPTTNAYYTLPAGAGAGSQLVDYNFGGQNVSYSMGGSEVFQGTVAAAWKPFGDWQVDASYTYGHDKSFSNYSLDLDQGALAAALASSDKATAFNPYGPNSASVLNSVFIDQFNAPGINKEQQAVLSATGTLVHLPGGNLRVAVGAELEHQSLLTGYDFGPADALFSQRSTTTRTVKSLFGEILVPIFGKDNALPGLQRLELSVAGRVSHYSDFGTTTNPKVGVNWSPVQGFTLHGTYGTSFRAPTLNQIGGPGGALYVQNYTTPTGNVTGVTVSGLQGGNPVAPEKARTFTLGGDYKPAFLPGLTLSATYWDVRYTNQINGILSDLTILQNPQTKAQYADRIVEGSAATALVNQFVASGYPVIGVLPNNPTLFVYGNVVNSGITLARGIDFQAGYRFKDFFVGTNGTLFTKYSTAASPRVPVINQLNYIFYPPSFRTRSTVEYTHGNVSAQVYLNYTGPYNNNRVDPVQRVGGYATVDLHLAYTWKNASLMFANGVTFAVDATNVFNKNPPFVDIAQSPNGGGGFDPTTTNPIGRIVALTASTKL